MLHSTNMQADLRSTTTFVLIGAAALGGIIGVGSAMVTPEGRAATSAAAKDIGVATGFRRQRVPQPGDHWDGCDDARAIGSAPIYEGEPGYDVSMDGDADGIACEPVRQKE